MTNGSTTPVSERSLRQSGQRSLCERDESPAPSHKAFHNTVSETNETPARPKTYRDIARVIGCSPATAWRYLNRGRRHTRTDVMQDQRFALVLTYRGQGLSIRAIARVLDTSRGAVERDLRLARELVEAGFDVVEKANRTIREAQESQAAR